MTPKITNEMRAIRRSPGQPIIVEDDETETTYVLVEASRSQETVDEWLRRELEPAIAASERGEVLPFDPERIRAIGRQLLGTLRESKGS
jgi:hypothetical protein